MVNFLAIKIEAGFMRSFPSSKLRNHEVAQGMKSADSITETLHVFLFLSSLSGFPHFRSFRPPKYQN